MIDFPCKCGYAFSVPLDQAGAMIQCPVCGLLADVPRLSDLAQLNPDGTFAFDEHASPTDMTTASDLHGIFTNRTTSTYGVVKDLRPTAAHFSAIDEVEEIAPLAAPRYDPVTGELIRPLPLKDEKPIPVISIGTLIDPANPAHQTAGADEEEEIPLPVEAIPQTAVPPIPTPRKLGYAIGDTRKQVTFKTLAVELLMPANAAVMFFVFLLYILGYYTSFGLVKWADTAEFTTIWPMLLFNLPMWMILSHLASVIEDTGPDAIDELPRPLRDISLGEDFIHPLLGIVLAGVLCFWPTVLAIHKLNFINPAALPLLFALALLGSFFLPAVLLTTVTGTTLLNLRFDRLLAVMRLAGVSYFASIALFLLAIIPSVYFLAAGVLFHPLPATPINLRLNRPTTMLGMLLLTVYLLHFFAWHLGLLYRQHHDQYPWLAQRHIKTPKSQRGLSPQPNMETRARVLSSSQPHEFAADRPTGKPARRALSANRRPPLL
jgi:hypothetical protein